MSELLSYILDNEAAFRRARLPSLYSDFSLQRHTNPDGYASNVAAWQQALAHAALAGHVPSPSTVSHANNPGIHSEETVASHKNSLLTLHASNSLMAELETREWGRPVALQSVFDEALRSGIMVPLDLFLNSSTTPFQSGWFRLPAAPSLSQILTWSMKQARGIVMGAGGEHSEGSGQLQTGDLVLVENLKRAATRVTKAASARHNSAMDRIYSKELFMRDFSHLFGQNTDLSPTDFNILLTFLSRDQNIILYDGKTIKFRSPDDKSNSITHEDGTIASLKTIITNLTTQVAKLDAKIKDLTLTAQRALKDKNRILALSTLRSKKLAEQNLKQRVDTLAQVEQVYIKIEQAVDQVDIVRVMEASTGVLKQLNAQVGGVDKVEDVVEQLRMEMDNVDEVGNALNEAGPVIDEVEIDDELQEMEDQERAAQEKKESEITRQKLAELERTEGTVASPVPNPAASTSAAKPADRSSVEDLEERIDRLSQMSIDDKNPGAREKQNQVDRSAAAE